ncbi:MAG: peptide-binding protein [Candidatus Krumholzibacteriota bacterium]|nr:peptide-binding protein [Candidatus Krumholzibacteriota bacterium]
MNIDRKIFRGAAGCLVVVLILAAGSCSGRRKAAQRGGTLIVGEINDYESLNPMQTTDAHARDVYDLLFLSLLYENEDFLTFKPRLAKSWEFSPDRKRLTFHLRRDVVWSDGQKCTAYDVQATFRAQTDPELVWSGRHLKQHVDSVEVIDDWTVVYHFSHIYPYQLMDVNDGPILPKHFLESREPAQIKMAAIEEIPVNGPFRIEEWVKGQSLTLVPNRYYYEPGKPYLDKVIFKIIPDQTTLITQLRSGEIDCMESIPPREIENLSRNNPELKIFDFPTRAYIYLAWNSLNPLFAEPRVRRALTMGIDRKLIIDNLYYGFAEECTSPFVPLLWAYNPNIQAIPYDPEGARKILAEEGFADADGDGFLERGGRKLEFDLLTNQGNQIRNDIQVMVTAQLEKIGVKVNPVVMEWTVMLERYKTSQYDAVINAWRIGTKADLAPIWGCEARREGGYNRVNYCNQVVDSLNALACQMLDFDEARPLFHRIQEIIYQDQPYTFLYVPHALFALDNRFQGARPDPISMYHNLYEWWVAKSDAGGE